MRSSFASICISSLLVPGVASAVFAQSDSNLGQSVKHPFMLHSQTRSELPKAEVIIGEDGAKITRRAKIDPTISDQIDQGRAQTHGTISVH